MKVANNKFMLRQLKTANTDWFSKGNKSFFQDREYFYFYSLKTGQPYLGRSTYKFSDMFGQPKKLSYCLNELEETKIGKLLDLEFETLNQVKSWLSNN
jgi:hypothetical protein